jgi:hypothetical protein
MLEEGFCSPCLRRLDSQGSLACEHIFDKLMSATAELLLKEIKKLPQSDQRQIVQQILNALPQSKPKEAFGTIKVGGGPITSEQVSEMLDDE